MARIAQGLLAVLVTALMFVASGASAAQRWAVVLAVAEYEEAGIPNLDNTVNDGRTMASALNQMGFKVYYLENAKKSEFDATIERVVAENQGSDLGFFYFAGHGLQVDGENYALPSDIKPTGGDFLRDQGISIGRVVRRLKDSGVENLVVVLDACRNSPFNDAGAIGTGLALIDAPENTIIAYSTSPGELALDGSGANSPYTAALATALEGPEQDVRDVLRLVRAQVRLATGGTQTPWFLDNSKGEIIIQQRRAGALLFELPILEYEDVTLSATAWWTIANSADPRDFKNFLELFPNSELSDSARRQLTLASDSEIVDFPLMNLNVPVKNPEVPGGLNSLITACDILATGLHGPMNLVEAVPHDLVNERAALRACTEAVRNDLENPRLLGLLARVLFLQERYPEALYYSELAAERGNSAAFGDMAAMYRLGLGVETDLVKAAALVREGALRGSPEMRVMMGVYYREGWGVPQSDNEARRWFEVAAHTGNTSALSALGDLYRRGMLGDPDPRKALDYYQKAATLGQTDAMSSIGMIYLRGEGLPQNYELGIRFLSQASELGNPYAAFHLGRAFWRGLGVEKNPTQALAYFRLAAQRNNLVAYVLVGDVLKSEGEQAEAFANYVIARDGGKLRDTKGSRNIANTAEERLAALTPNMSLDAQSEGERIANEWIEQYGLLDFNLVNE